MPPLRPDPDEAGHRRGRHIEDQLLNTLRDAQARGVIEGFLQPDAVVLTKTGGIYFVEAKSQDHYEAPPFDGHGLPRSQVRGYMKVWLRTKPKIRTWFVVYDGDRRYDEWLDHLEDGGDDDRHDTPGTIKSVRRIYPLSRFNVKQP